MPLLMGLPAANPTAMIWGFSLCALVVAAIIFRDATLPLHTAILGGLIVLIGCAPGILFLASQPEQRTAFPLFPLTGLFYAVFFGVPAFMAHLLRDPETGQIHVYQNAGFQQILAEAQFLVISGLVLLWSCYSLATRNLPRNASRWFRFPAGTNGTVGRLLSWGLLLAHLGYLVFPEIRLLPSIGQFFQPVGFIACAMLYVFWRRGYLCRAESWLFILGCLPLIAIYHVTTTFLTSLVLFVVLFGSIEFWFRGKLPWVPAVLASLVFVSVYPVFTPIRERVWLTTPDGSIPEKLDAVAQAISDFATGRLEGNPGGYTGFTVRLGQIFVFSEVVKKTPNQVAYWGGETYKPLLTSFIPRVVWPGKPEERTGGAFGQRYGFLGPNDPTSANLPWITEAYANFGLAGLCIGMSLIGLLIAVLEAVFCRRDQSDANIAVGAGLCLPVFFQESNFSVMMGTFIPLTICILLYFHFGCRLVPSRPSNS